MMDTDDLILAVERGVPGSEPVPRIQDLPVITVETLLDPDTLPVPGTHYVEWENALWRVKRSSFVTENQYVLMETEETRRMVARYEIHDQVLSGDKYVDMDPGERLQKANEHARWRYRGYLAGQVASL